MAITSRVNTVARFTPRLGIWDAWDRTLVNRRVVVLQQPIATWGRDLVGWRGINTWQQLQRYVRLEISKNLFSEKAVQQGSRKFWESVFGGFQNFCRCDLMVITLPWMGFCDSFAPGTSLLACASSEGWQWKAGCTSSRSEACLFRERFFWMLLAVCWCDLLMYWWFDTEALFTPMANYKLGRLMGSLCAR